MAGHFPCLEPLDADADAASEMSNEFELPNYSDPSEEIRLLEIQPGCRDDALDCAMTVFPFENALEYGAISYTWETVDKRRGVDINGQTALIDENCYYAMGRVRLHGFGKYCWIDAMCINQDDVQERLLLKAAKWDGKLKIGR